MKGSVGYVFPGKHLFARLLTFSFAYFQRGADWIFLFVRSLVRLKRHTSSCQTEHFTINFVNWISLWSSKNRSADFGLFNFELSSKKDRSTRCLTKHVTILMPYIFRGLVYFMKLKKNDRWIWGSKILKCSIMHVSERTDSNCQRKQLGQKYPRFSPHSYFLANMAIDLYHLLATRLALPYFYSLKIRILTNFM